MVVGDITFEVLGPFQVDDKSGAMETAMENENMGSATAGADTTTFDYVVASGQVFIYKIFREQA